MVIRQGEAFRSIIIVGSSALRTVGSVPRDGDMLILRKELLWWDRLVFELNGITVPVFGDYTVIHPDFTAIGRSPNANAKIRYTHGRYTTYFRGHGLFRPTSDFLQYHALASKVTLSPSYAGPMFSAGDAYIDRIATGDGTGNLGTWVKADVNRHLTFVSRQLSNRAQMVLSASTVEELNALN